SAPLLLPICSYPNCSWLVSSVTGRERECGRVIAIVLDEWCNNLPACEEGGRRGEGKDCGRWL
ncbi:unnamed protein product, partial [Closterium sp. NIES-53]